MEEPMNLSAFSEEAQSGIAPNPVAQAAWHGLMWLVVANTVGVMLAVLLLFPSLNGALGEWSYGRWMMVHLNLELYGWTSMPLLGFLFKVYGVDRGPAAVWCRPVLWVWSAALGAGALAWLSGDSSGKLFLDWQGYTRILFIGALLTLWLFLLLKSSLLSGSGLRSGKDRRVWWAKLVGLVVLLAVPLLLYFASSPAVYPPINPDTGGPTGASQLESSLIVVLILLTLPCGIARRLPGKRRAIGVAWWVLAAESTLCAAMGRANASHHQPLQYMSLGTLLLWLPLIPAYYSAFAWHDNTRRWRTALYGWWGALVVTGWVLFLPGVLDKFKFTDGLVGHTFVAMAGFTSTALILVVVQILGDGGWVFNRTRSFYAWHGSVIAYAALMTIAGWLEQSNPAFTMIPGTLRNLLYALRLLTGSFMLLASLDWFVGASRLLREPTSLRIDPLQEKTA